MPIYEYACMECESHFEELVRNAEQAVSCPECGAANVLKQLSTFAVHGSAANTSRFPRPFLLYELMDADASDPGGVVVRLEARLDHLWRIQISERARAALHSPVFARLV